MAQGRRQCRFKNPLLSLDASVIDLGASLFDWAKYKQTKGAVKLHRLLDHAGDLPSYAVITEGRRHEVRVARTWTFAPGTLLVFDRGYADYAWFAELTPQGVFFVTRLKDNVLYAVVGSRAVPARGSVLTDELIQVTGLRAAARCPYVLRRGGGHRPGDGRDARLPHEPTHVRPNHHRPDLSGPLAD